MTNNELLAKVLVNSEVAWKVLTSRIRVFGPWEDNKSYPRGSIMRHCARTDSERKYLSINLLVSRSQTLREPKEYEYHILGGVDWEEFELAKEEYEQEKLKWKEWHWVLDRFDHEQSGYADSKQEAIRLADNCAESSGYLIYNGD